MLDKCPELLSLCEKILEQAKTEFKKTKSSKDEHEKSWLEKNQFLLHGLAWLATYVDSLTQ